MLFRSATRDRESRLNSEEANTRLRKARDTVEEVAKAEARVRMQEEKLSSVKQETERAAGLLEKHREEHRMETSKIAAEHAELDRREQRLRDEREAIESKREAAAADSRQAEEDAARSRSELSECMSKVADIERKSAG